MISRQPDDLQPLYLVSPQDLVKINTDKTGVDTPGDDNLGVIRLGVGIEGSTRGDFVQRDLGMF